MLNAQFRLKTFRLKASELQDSLEVCCFDWCAFLFYIFVGYSMFGLFSIKAFHPNVRQNIRIQKQETEIGSKILNLPKIESPGYQMI